MAEREIPPGSKPGGIRDEWEFWRNRALPGSSDLWSRRIFVVEVGASVRQPGQFIVRANLDK